ncbi:hypothetical protein QBC37DRAFT_177803 [Rhypophila decipiens]|uniref:Uncharacterized protein n=1 Tax=Rhypophila decipiens TaxID=261697 RepID=A0AAN6YL86_9PEZI|nr:hypothetical protein QBC37DRAFT_177803 [Rhypophila decipiens]
MSSIEEKEEEALHAAQKILDPYIRPREEVAHIRRILALHLDSCLKDGSAVSPLALVESSEQRTSPATRGLYKEYLEALGRNVKAQEEYKACVQAIDQTREEKHTATAPNEDPIHDHLATIILRKKQERLQVVEQHIRQLEQKPAASTEFLDPKEMFRYSCTLPEVPRDVVNSLVTLDDNARPSTHLKDLIDQLEKHVLRTKLLLNREEQLLEEVKQRTISITSDPRAISESAKFEALNATRVELINWIETELGKASGTGGEDQQQQYSQEGSKNGTTRLQMDESLASIKEKYARYSDARKALLQLVSQQPRPSMKPQTSQDRLIHSEQQQQPDSTWPRETSAHLLSPYLSQLLLLSHTQKSLISQKSHLTSTISKQLKETWQHLDRLAQESQLIPAHPMPGVGGGAARRKPPPLIEQHQLSGISQGTDTTTTTNKIKPWVYAADSAKIATLEAVAEKIDEGQMAIETSMRTIGEIETLLGVNRQTSQHVDSGNGDDNVTATADDIWLAAEGGAGGKPSRRSVGAAARRHNSEAPPKKSAEMDVWSLLDGNLGLLGGENASP